MSTNSVPSQNTVEKKKFYSVLYTIYWCVFQPVCVFVSNEKREKRWNA